jgi:dCMP deaminase
MSRITRDEMLMRVVEAVALRGTCERQPPGGIGAVIALDGRVLSTGYVGAPAGLPHCTEVGCEVDEGRGGCVRTVHAEANAIAFAARKGISVEGASMYCTYSPCIDCAKLVINAGIVEFHFQKPYRADGDCTLLVAAGVIITWHKFRA